MSGQIPSAKNVEKAKSRGTSGSTIGDDASKVVDKVQPEDYMKIEFKADREDECEELKEITATDRTPENEQENIHTAHDFDNDVREFDADQLSTWSQSSGSISYDSGWSLRSIVKNLTFNAKRMDLQPVLPLMQAEKKQVVSGITPSLITLDEHMLAQLNKGLRLRALLGDMHTHIAVKDRRTPSERRGIITKLFDDSLQQYLSSTSKEKRQICLRVECGGNAPPSLTITCAPGQREQHDYKDQNAYEITDNIHSQMANEDESTSVTVTAQRPGNRGDIALRYPNYASLSSTSLVYPLMPSFSRCSISDHVRRVRRGRSPLRLLDSTVSSE